MTTYLLPLIADASPNDGTVNPPSPATQFDKLDEDPHDGDTTRVNFLVPGNVVACALNAAVIPDGAIITSVTVRWTIAGRLDDACTAKAGLRIANTYHYGPPLNLAAGAPYTTRNEAFGMLHPGTGQRWKKADLLASAVVCQYVSGPPDPIFPPRPRLSQLVAIVEAEPPPPAAGPSSPLTMARTGGLTDDTTAAPYSDAPGAVPVAPAPEAVPSGDAPQGGG